MIKIVFIEENIEQLRNMSIHHPHHIVQRKALALLLKNYSISHHLIAEILGICENTLRSYFDCYLESGIEGITKINYKGAESALVPFNQVILDYVNTTPPSSIKQACKEIAELTNVSLKATQMRKHLKSLNIKFRKVGGIPAKADIEQQQKFLENELQPKLDEAENGLRSVYFMDAAHFVLGGFLGYLWSLKRIFVKTPSGRQRFNVLGGLNATTKELLTISNATYITSTQVCELLELIHSKEKKSATKSKKPTVVVSDNAKYQRCKLVIEKAKELGIELLFLPPYSPNLNLIERLWKFTKKYCLNSKYHSDFDVFKMAISNFLTSIHIKYATELKTLLTLKFQVFEKDQFSSAN